MALKECAGRSDGSLVPEKQLWPQDPTPTRGCRSSEPFTHPMGSQDGACISGQDSAT